MTKLREVKTRVPDCVTVVLLGDGEFDSPELRAEAARWAGDPCLKTAVTKAPSQGFSREVR